ncbi:MAG: hypothetical protein ACU837_16305 [Gammaproteobacteria bacterium]
MLIDKEIAQIITWTIVVIGWFVVDNRNNNRERRKEIRAIIDLLGKQLDAIELKAIQYHQGSHHSAQLAKDIKFSLQRTSQIIYREDLLAIEKGESKYYRDFKKSITLDNFDSFENFISQPDDSDLLYEISASKDALFNQIETNFHRKYCRSWFRFY